MSQERPHSQSFDEILKTLDGSKKREKHTISIEGTSCDVVAHDATSWTVYIKDRILAVTCHTNSVYRALDQTRGDNADPHMIALLSPIAIEAVKQSISIPQ